MSINMPYAIASIEELKSNIEGAVICPGDANYDSARMAWNLSYEHRPAVIIVAANAGDVANAVLYAQNAELSVAVQATGHGVILPADDAMLIVTAEMTAVRVDAQTQTAWVEAGAKWGAVLEKAQEVGLAPLLGSSPDVGAVGYTLGGGMGWLVRKYGMSADSVLYFDVITADGRMLRVSESENSDLFWGMRGGGGGFAIVTAMCIRLYPVTTVYGGSLIYPAAQAKEVFQFYRDWILWLPAEWTTSIAIMNFPPIPEVPEMLRGQSVVMVNGCYCGDATVGRMMLQSWLDWTPAIANTFHPMPFSEVSVISNDPLDPMPGLSSGGWLADLDNETIDLLIQYGVPQEGPAPLVKVEVRQTGGAISNVNASANAFSHRESPLVLSLIGVTPTPEIHQQVSAYVAALKGALEAHMTGIYPNFVEGHEAHNRTQDAFAAEKLERLTALKTKYDPENLFRFGYKITPKQGMLN